MPVGEIYEHAALCLRFAIDAAHTRTVEMVLVDLRDLTAITPAGLELFRAHTATCLAHGIDLGLLICGHQRHDQIAEAFVLAGLGNQLQCTNEARLLAAARPVTLLDHAHSVSRGVVCARSAALLPRRRSATTSP